MIKRLLLAILAIIGVSMGIACGVSPAIDNRFVTRFSIPIGFSEHLLFYSGRSDATRYQSLSIDMDSGVFTITNGLTNKINRYTSYGDLVFSLYDQRRNSNVTASRPVDERQSIASRYSRAHPFNFITDVATAAQGVFYVADRVPDVQIAYDDNLQSALHTHLIRYDTRTDTAITIGQEGVGGKPFPQIHDIYVVGNDQPVVICDVEDTWLVFWYSSRGAAAVSGGIWAVVATGAYNRQRCG